MRAVLSPNDNLLIEIPRAEAAVLIQELARIMQIVNWSHVMSEALWGALWQGFGVQAVRKGDTITYGSSSMKDDPMCHPASISEDKHDNE